MAVPAADSYRQDPAARPAGSARPLRRQTPGLAPPTVICRDPPPVLPCQTQTEHA